MKTKKKKPKTAKQINEEAYFLIEKVIDFLHEIANDIEDANYSPKSKELVSKIMKEWSGSVASGKVYNKKFSGKNKAKYSALIKHIAEFIHK